MIERRKSERCQIRQMIGYFPGREEYLWAEGVDLSREGLRCVSDQPVDPMTNLFLMLELEVGGTMVSINCEGFVKHSEMDGGRCAFGVKIERMSEADRRSFEAWFVEMEGRRACHPEGAAPPAQGDPPTA